MSATRRFRAMLHRVGGLFRRGALEAEMKAELQAHIDGLTERKTAEGMSPEAARLASLREFGGVTQVQERARDQRRSRSVEQFRQDLRYSVRSLAKSRSFTLTVVATFALCLGSNVVMFSIIHAVLLAPMDFPHPEQLVTMFNSYPNVGIARSQSSVPNYFERRDGGVPAFQEVGAYRRGSFIVTGDGPARREEAIRVTPSFWRVLEARAARGRLFTEEEAVYSKHHVAVISDRYWRHQFGADPAVIGRTLPLDGEAVTIVGVLPPDFGFLSWAPPIWRPLPFVEFERLPGSRHSNTTQLIARLRPGATLAQAQAQLDALNRQRLSDDPKAAWAETAGYRTIVANLREDHVVGIRPALVWLQGGALVLLLIGGFNVMNLLLIRESSRAKEWAVRQVLGAGRLRIARRILIESVVLAFIGGVVGISAGAATLQLLSVFGVERLPLSRTISLDGTVAATAFGVAIATGLLLALPLVGFSVHRDPGRSLNSESRSSTANRHAQRWRQGLITAQVAFAFALLVCATLMGRSLQELLEVDPGFRPEHVATGSVFLRGESYRDGSARASFAERWLDSLRAVPGVTSAGLGTTLPLSGKPSDITTGFSHRPAESSFGVDGEIPPADAPEQTHYFSEIAGDYLATLGVPLLAGRYIIDADMRRTERVCVVDEAFARQYWPEGGALGHRIRAKIDHRTDMTIVGVVGTVKQMGLDESQPRGTVFRAITTNDPPLWIAAVVRSDLDSSTVLADLRQTLAHMDPDLVLENSEVMRARIAEAVKPQRTALMVAGFFSVAALLLAGVGIYGVLAFAIGQRQREIGIRIALGALPAQIRRHFVRLGLRMFFLGLAIGIVLAWMAGRAMRSLLFGVSPSDPMVFIFGIIAIGTVVWVASLLPSNRAAQVSPLEALRHD